MNSAKERLLSVGLLVLRLGSGGLLIYGHGWGKITKYAERAPEFADPIGLGPETSFALVVFAEVFCAAAVMLGLGTRLAAVPILIFTAVAVFVQHAADPFANKEKALLFAVPMLTLMLTGGGRYSLDAVLGKLRRGRRAS
ncbi:MAG TPA: DoxX family protein [Candidatus Eisenbacteria bacterium]|nr:DoxX family protein [Candidatus Eisenbacteria bacterium]